MKNLLLPILFAVFCFSVNAQQLPNAGFESWVTIDGQMDPEDYYTSDIVNFINNNGLENVSQSTDAHGGQYSAKITTFTYVNTVPAQLFLGSTGQGVPFTGRPVTLRGWYKSELNNESASMYVTLRRTVSGFPEEVGSIFHSFMGSAGWTMFEDTISYVSTETPDTITLELLLAGADTLGSVYIDDFEFTYANTNIDELNLSINAKLYPNPTSDVSTLISHLPKDYQVSITDITGKIIYQVVMQNDRIQLPKLNAGIYGVAIMNPNGKIVYRDKLITQ